MFRLGRPNRRWILAAGRRGRLAAGLALITTVAVLIVVVLGARSTTSPQSTINSAAASGSTTVQRRDLVETDTESGTLGYADPRTVFDHVSGTITWLPHVGQLIKPGQPLFDANERPVILLDGTTPAYRDLSPSDTAGQDILQLNRNLVALGFNPDGIVVDDTWQAATTVGLDLLQSSLGETETGSVSLGQIAFLPGAQLISNVEATLGDGGGTSTGAASTSTHPAEAGTEFIGVTTTTTTPTTTTTTSASAKPKPTERVTAHKPSISTNPQTSAALTALLRAEAAQLKAATAALKAANAASTRSRSSSSKPSAGASGSTHSASSSPSSGGGSGSAVLQTSSTQLTATVDLDASKQSEARVGETVTVEMPAGNTLKGVVTAVSSVAQSSSSSASGASPSGASSNDNGGSASSGATIPVTIRLKGHVRGAGLDQAAVSVNFNQAFANNVLSVPVTALLATPGGGYAVQEADAPHKLIPVTTGVFAAGYVEISGQRIYPGLPVTNSQG